MMKDGKTRALVAILDHRLFIPATFAVYFALRLAVIIWVPIHQTSDELWYYNRAVALAAGQGYSQNHIATAYWPVGWPGFLGGVFWLTGPSPLVGQIVNLLCSAAIFVSTLRLGAILFADRRVGRLAVLMLAISPNQIAYVPALGTELFYTALLLAAVDLLVCGEEVWRSVAAGLVFGIAALTKAQTLLLPAALLAAWWAMDVRPRRWPSRLGGAAALYTAMAVVVLPWTARNYQIFHEIVPISTNGGLALLTGNNPSAQGDFTPHDPLVERVPHGVAQQVAADHLATALAWQWIREHPEATLQLAPKKIWWLWAPDGEGEWVYEAGYPAYAEHATIFRTLRLINQAYYVTLIGLALASLFYLARGVPMPRREAATGYVLILFTTAISVIFFGQSRFHFPMMPWIAMYAAWSLLEAMGANREPAPAPA